jgi:hypothetical protein
VRGGAAATVEWRSLGAREPPAPPIPGRRSAISGWERELYPTVQAMNKHVVLTPRDWIAGVLILGGQGTGKSSIMLRNYLNAISDPGAAVVLIDPKTSLAKRALALTPIDCGKRVWYLNLGHPAFGMSPLRVDAPRQALTDLFVESFRDVMGDRQIFQASRSVIENCVLGALAIAEVEKRPARVEDVRALMVWEESELRGRVIDACATLPNGDLVRDYFARELPGDMTGNMANMRQRLQAPRNKLDALLHADSLRIFFNHTSERPLGQIIEDRDILIVDADLGEAGDENSRLVISFVLRMLNLVLQRQMKREPEQRSRVHLLVDESAQVLNETTMRMIETHREAGLTATLAFHYLAQLQDEYVLKGVLNLLANRCIFRISDPEDAERVAQVARAVFSALRDTPQSRDRQRVSPEALRDLRRWHCLRSWAPRGGRAAAFVGRTYPMPAGAGATEFWRSWLEQQVGEYPEHLLWTLRAEERAREATASGTEGPGGHAEAQVDRSSAVDGTPERPVRAAPAAATPPDRSGAVTEPPAVSQPSAVELADAALLPVSPARGVVGATRPPAIDLARFTVPAPEPIKELALIDRITRRVREPMETGGSASGKLPRLNERDLSALAALDRLGFLLAGQLGRSSWPGRSSESVRQNLDKLARAGLIARYRLELEDAGRRRRPYLYALTVDGMRVAQRPPGGLRPSISERREYRPSEAVEGQHIRHNLRVATWLLSFHRAFPQACTDNWRTPRYASGHLDLPRVAAGRTGHRPVSIHEVPLPEGYALTDISSPCELAPDASIELRLEHDGRRMTTDLLVEVDNTKSAEYNAQKFRAYDSFLAGWCLAHRRYQSLGSRPVAVIVCASIEAMRGLMRRADAEMTARVGIKGTADPSRWYYAGRDHLLFTTVELIHYGLPTAWLLPPQPPAIREQLGQADGYRARPAALLPVSLLAVEAMVGWELREGEAIVTASEE